MSFFLLNLFDIFVAFLAVKDLAQKLVFNIEALYVVKGSLLVLLKLSLYS
jgi:hypothetical protein